jgi:very-short-patch-repair endonuclease
MILSHDLDYCMCCPDQIHYNEFTFSAYAYGIPMCQDCVRQYIAKIPESTEVERMLYTALVCRGIPAELQYFDGFKTVDIAIQSARLHIEVDGVQHGKADQALTDLLRTKFSLDQEVVTLRIPNSLVLQKLDDTTSILAQVSMSRQQVS